MRQMISRLVGNFIQGIHREGLEQKLCQLNPTGLYIKTFSCTEHSTTQSKSNDSPIRVQCDSINMRLR